MRYSASEKLEIIELVEHRPCSVGRTLASIGIPRSTFYDWSIDIGRGDRGSGRRQAQTAAGLEQDPRRDPRRRSSTWPLMSRICRRANWPSTSPTPRPALSRKPAFIGF